MVSVINNITHSVELTYCVRTKIMKGKQ